MDDTDPVTRDADWKIAADDILFVATGRTARPLVCPLSWYPRLLVWQWSARPTGGVGGPPELALGELRYNEGIPIEARLFGRRVMRFAFKPEGKWPDGLASQPLPGAGGALGFHHVAGVVIGLTRAERFTTSFFRL